MQWPSFFSSALTQLQPVLHERNSILVVVIHVRFLDESLFLEQQAIAAERFVPGELGDHQPNPAGGEVRHYMRHDRSTSSGLPRGLRHDHRVQCGSADGPGNQTVHPDTRTFTVSLNYARVIFAGYPARCLLEDLRDSIEPSDFCAPPFHQSKRGGEIALAHRAHKVAGIDAQRATIRIAHRNYMCMERPVTPRAASFTASDNVGWECTVMPISSDDPRYSKASTTS